MCHRGAGDTDGGDDAGAEDDYTRRVEALKNRRCDGANADDGEA